MAQSIPTVRIPFPPPPPPTIRAFVLFVFVVVFLMLQMPHGGASTFMQIPMVGPWEECKYPTHGTSLKFYLMIVAKNILIPAVSVVFLMVFEALFCFSLQLQRTSKSVLKRGVLMVSIFVLCKL